MQDVWEQEAQRLAGCDLRGRPLLWLSDAPPGARVQQVTALFERFAPSHLYIARPASMAMWEAGLADGDDHAVVVDVGHAETRVKAYFNM